MVNVLYVIDRLGQRSGITTVVRNYILNINTTEVHIDLVVGENSEKNLIEELRNNGSMVYIMPEIKKVNLYTYIKWWRNFFKKSNYDIIHSHFIQIDFLLFVIAKISGVKICISHSHSAALSDSRLKSIRNFLLCFPLRFLADRLVACSDLAGESLFGDKFVYSKKKYLLHNAIIPSLFAYDEKIREHIRHKYNMKNKFVIGNVGRFYQPKNKLFLLKILKELLKYDKNVCLLNIGDGEDRGIFEKIARKEGLDKNIVMTGQVSNVNDYMQAMDVFVLPSLYEGLPVVGIEAQASGLPCVFSDVITREVDLLSGNNRYLSLNTDIRVWAETIFELRECKRGDMSLLLQEKGYDIKTESNLLMFFYRSILRRR